MSRVVADPLDAPATILCAAAARAGAIIVDIAQGCSSPVGAEEDAIRFARVLNEFVSARVHDPRQGGVEHDVGVGVATVEVVARRREEAQPVAAPRSPRRDEAVHLLAQ